MAILWTETYIQYHHHLWCNPLAVTGLPMLPKQHLLTWETSTSAHLLMYHPPEHRTIYNIQYQKASLLRCLIPLLAFLGDQIMPNSTPHNPQPGVYPILVALPPAFHLHMYNPLMTHPSPSTRCPWYNTFKQASSKIKLEWGNIAFCICMGFEFPCCYGSLWQR